MTMAGNPEGHWDRAPELALVTCGPQLEVALSSPDLTTTSIVRLGGPTPRSTLVLAAVDLLVEDAGISRSALGTVVVSRGPGSFTGIRAGLATAMGLATAIGAECRAFDSLLMHAARSSGGTRVWTAQPGRRGEVYVSQYELPESGPPVGTEGISMLPVGELGGRGPWIAADALDLGGAERGGVVRSAAEALLELARWQVPSQPVEPLYVEGPPIHVARDEA
jgi:tRNA threonylcarbamoyl adenosine modification protein YeaZ